jgi:hypothetical protein
MVSTRESGAHLQVLYGRQRDAEKHATNWRQRLAHVGRHGDDAENHDDSPTPTSVTAVKEGLANAEVKVVEIERLISDETRRGDELSQKSSSAIQLFERCKKAVAELSEESA